jgi:hypothetical protein
MCPNAESIHDFLTECVTLPLIVNRNLQPLVVVHTCNPSSQEAKAGGSRVIGQPKLQCKTLSQKQKQQQKTSAATPQISRVNHIS